MNPARYNRIVSIFEQVVALEGYAREDLLNELCGSDWLMRADVESMLKHDGQAGRFVEYAKVNIQAAAQEALLDRSANDDQDQVGPYRLVSQLGSGGMGVVYKAEQSSPVKRTVAVKVVRPGLNSKEVLARFDSERQALALMNHPHVARVFDAGTDDWDRPYFALELVEGSSLTSYCDNNKLDISARLGLFIKVCEAVQHAHQKGIIHRDIKPSNIMVTHIGGVPVPKVIDFGVAKAIDQQLTDQTLVTSHGQLIGTPQYMSPEQAAGQAELVDTRTDIYSLGALLYELLTGVLPYESLDDANVSLRHIERAICEDEPIKPSIRVATSANASAPGEDLAGNRGLDRLTLGKLLAGELDWITMKALEKDPDRRYLTASDLAADLNRFLKCEPVMAGPPSQSYRIRKFVRRNRAVVLACATTLIVLLAATAVSTTFAVSESHQRTIADDAKRLAEQREQEARVVIDFQSSMLSDIDTAMMGRNIVSRLRHGMEESLAQSNLDGHEIESVLGTFDDLSSQVNVTNLAKEIVDGEFLSRAGEMIERDFGDQPLVEAKLRDALGRTYRRIGMFDKARPHLEASLSIRREHLGSDDPVTLESVDYLGSLYVKMREFGLAEALLSEAYAGRTQVLGETDADTLESATNRGMLYLAAGQFDKAAEVIETTLATSREVWGDEHAVTQSNFHNMSTLFRHTGRLVEAETLQREVLAIRKKSLGDSHPKTFNAMCNLAKVLGELDKMDEAVALQLEALAGRRAVLGDDHPETLFSLANTGSVMAKAGKHAEAEQLYRECYERRLQTHGPDNQETLAALTGLTAVLVRTARNQEAEPLMRSLLEKQSRLIGEEHPTTQTTQNNLALLLKRVGKLEEAKLLYEKVLEIRTRKLGPDSQLTLTTQNNLGILLYQMGRFEEAVPFVASALEGAAACPWQ